MSPAFSCPREKVPFLPSDKGHAHRLGKQGVSQEWGFGVFHFPNHFWEEIGKHYNGIRPFWFKLDSISHDSEVTNQEQWIMVVLYIHGFHTHRSKHLWIQSKFFFQISRMFQKMKFELSKSQIL